MIGKMFGEEVVYVGRYAKSNSTKTFIIGTAGSQDPTLQLAQPNVFRYHGDGAQWNAGTGEIVEDPYGCPIEVYRACARHLDRLIQAAAARLEQELRNPGSSSRRP